MPHAEHLVRVAAAWEEARMKPFLSEAERVAHHFLTMLEAALGHPLPPLPPEEDVAPVAEPPAPAPMPEAPAAPDDAPAEPVAPEMPAAPDEAPAAPEMPMTDMPEGVPPT